MKNSKLKNNIVGGFELPVYHASTFLYGALQGTEFVSKYDGSLAHTLSTLLFFGTSFLISVDGAYRLALNKSLVGPCKEWLEDKKINREFKGILKQIDNTNLEGILKK